MVQNLETEDTRINRITYELEQIVRIGEVVGTNVSGSRVQVEIVSTYGDSAAPARSEIVDCIYMAPPYGRKTAIWYRPTARRTLQDGDAESPTQGEFGLVIKPFRASFHVFIGGLRESPVTSIDPASLLLGGLIGDTADPADLREAPSLLIASQEDADSSVPTRGIMIGEVGAATAAYLRIRSDVLLVSLKNTLGKYAGLFQEFVLPIVNAVRVRLKTSHATEAQNRGFQEVDDWSDVATVPVSEFTIPLPSPFTSPTITAASTEMDLQTSYYATLLEDVDIQTRDTGGAWVNTSYTPEFDPTITEYHINEPRSRTGIRVKAGTANDFTVGAGGPYIQLWTVDANGDPEEPVELTQGEWSGHIPWQHFAITARKSPGTPFVEKEYIFIAIRGG